MTRQLLAAVFVAVVLGTAIGFTLGSEASPESANAATGNAEVIKQLKRINVQMGTLKRKEHAEHANRRHADSKEASARCSTIICDYTAPINCKPR